ncbi:MAG: hypothetical protein CIT01_06020 [Methanobacterium sp. BRmetb2]|nr:MAG: hypothetical protein CIT01_06020 [Methanobacterium sp. BRmetb2]
MDNKGLIVSSDAILALIVVFILLATVTNISGDKSGSFIQQVVMAKNAQDAMELMATYKNISTNKTVLELMADQLIKNGNQRSGMDDAGQIASEFLDKTLSGSNYNLIEINKLNGTPLASNADMNNADNISSASRTCGEYIFKLYIWD